MSEQTYDWSGCGMVRKVGPEFKVGAYRFVPVVNAGEKNPSACNIRIAGVHALTPIPPALPSQPEFSHPDYEIGEYRLIEKGEKYLNESGYVMTAYSAFGPRWSIRDKSKPPKYPAPKGYRHTDVCRKTKAGDIFAGADDGLAYVASAGWPTLDDTVRGRHWILEKLPEPKPPRVACHIGGNHREALRDGDCVLVGLYPENHKSFSVVGGGQRRVEFTIGDDVMSADELVEKHGVMFWRDSANRVRWANPGECGTIADSMFTARVAATKAVRESAR